MAMYKLYDELGELARYLDSAMRKMAEVGAPMVANSAQLPQATAHLARLEQDDRRRHPGSHAFGRDHSG